MNQKGGVVIDQVTLELLSTKPVDDPQFVEDALREIYLAAHQMSLIHGYKWEKAERLKCDYARFINFFRRLIGEQQQRGDEIVMNDVYRHFPANCFVELITREVIPWGRLMNPSDSSSVLEVVKP